MIRLNGLVFALCLSLFSSQNAFANLADYYPPRVDYISQQAAKKFVIGELAKSRSIRLVKNKLPFSSDLSNWKNEVVEAISRNTHYPAESVSRGEHGTAVVTFTLDRNGRLLRTRVHQSSGSVALDQEAVATLRRSDPFPRLPPNYPSNTIELTLPMRFALPEQPASRSYVQPSTPPPTGLGDEAKKEPLPHRDPDDVVAQVLNYTVFGNDDGFDGSFWFKEVGGRCRYTLNIAADQTNENLLRRLLGMNAAIMQRRVIDLDELDPRNITFHYNNNPDLWGENGVGTIVQHINEVLFFYMGTLDLSRLQRGWTLIYDKYCSGKARPF